MHLSIVALSGSAAHAVQISWHVVLIIVLAVVANVIVRRSINGVTSQMRARAEDALGVDEDGIQRVDPHRRVEARISAVSSMLKSLSGVLIFTVAFLLVLGELSVQLGPLLAGAGIAGVAIGFGSQSLVRDLVAGFFVLVEDQYGVGDVIDAGPATGTVERITLRVTQLRDASGTMWHIPNGTILRVGNKSQNWSRAVIDVLVSHGTDVRLARQTLGAVAESMLKDPDWSLAGMVSHPEEQGVQALTAEGVTLRLVVDTEPTSRLAVEREMRLRITEAFAEAGLNLGSVGPASSSGDAGNPTGAAPSTT